MKKLSLIIIIFILLNGCTDETTIISPPDEQERLTITIANLPESLTDFEGVQCEVPFIVTVESVNGEAFSGRTLNLSVSLGAGEITPAQSVTDRSGRVQALYRVQMPNGSASAQILAEADGYTTTANIALNGRNRPVDIFLNAGHERIVTLPGEDAEIAISVSVVDTSCVGIPDVHLRASLLPAADNLTILGYITQPQSTDSEGQSQLTFHTAGSYGTVILRCAIDHPDSQLNAVASEIRLEVDLLHNLVCDLQIDANPDYLEPSADSIALSTVRVVALDADDYGIAGLPIEFSADIGLIEREAVTDEYGVATVRFNNNFEYGTAAVTACVPGTEWEAQTVIEIVNPEAGLYSLTLETDRYFIWADNGLTSANLTAVLKDDNDNVVAGESIDFSATHGVIQSFVVTDSSGRANTIFTDIGLPSVDEYGNPDSAIVTARFPEKDIEASVRIMIRERNPVTTINLHVNARQLTANTGDSTAVHATCYLGDGSTAPPGMEVHFRAVYGSYTNSLVAITGQSGIADNWYIAGRQVTTDTLTAFVWTPMDTAYSNQVLIDLISGPPAVMVIRANPMELITNDPASMSEITATVMDISGNPVRQGTYVTFETTLGTITPSAITDEQGDAIAMLTPGVQAGLAQVTARTQGATGPIEAQATVSFISCQPYSIELTADPLEIAVAGTGDNTISFLSATVRDINGNLVQLPLWVVFELVNAEPPPEWNFRVVSQTINGVATACFNSVSEQIGSKLIRAYTWPDSANHPDEIIEAFILIMVVAGPPFQLDIDVDDNGIDAGGGAWAIEVSARIWDLHRNPVADGIPVFFTVDPEIANIDPGLTGNQGWNNRPVRGLAYATMVYNSVNTYDPIEISAEVQTQQGQITGEREHILPLQEGSLTLHIDPANWMFEDEDVTATIRCWAVLIDGHRIPINNAPILFTSSRGRFYWYNTERGGYIPFFPDPARKYTGVIDEENNEMPGTVTVYLRGVENDFFLENDGREVAVTINACVERTNVSAQPRFVIFTRR